MRLLKSREDVRHIVVHNLFAKQLKMEAVVRGLSIKDLTFDKALKNETQFGQDIINKIEAEKNVKKKLDFGL